MVVVEIEVEAAESKKAPEASFAQQNSTEMNTKEDLSEEMPGETLPEEDDPRIYEKECLIDDPPEKSILKGILVANCSWIICQ